MKYLRVALLLIFFLTSAVFAFEVITPRGPAGPPIKWNFSDIPVPYMVHQRGTADIPGTNEVSQIIQALGTWNPISRFKFQFAGRTANVRSFDSQNGIIFDQNFELDDSTLAFTETIFLTADPTRRIESDIHFNDRDFRWTTGPSNSSAGVFKVLPTAVHELGHSVGLDHSAIFNATMFFSDQGDDRGQTLHRDDKRGGKFLYNVPQNTLNVPRLLTPLNNTEHIILQNTDSQAALGITFRWAQNRTNNLSNFRLEFAGNQAFTQSVRAYNRARNQSFYAAPGNKLTTLKNIAQIHGQVFWRVTATAPTGGRVSSTVWRFTLRIVDGRSFVQ